MEDKVKIALKPIEAVKVVWNKDVILVEPYIPLETRIALATHYFNIKDSAENEMRGIIEAEHGLFLGIIGLCTNIDTTEVDEDGSFLFDGDLIIASGLWEKIVKEITNYDSFRSELSTIAQLRKPSEIASSKLANLIDKGNALVDKLKDIDIKAMSGELNAELAKLSNVIPVAKTEKPKRQYHKKG